MACGKVWKIILVYFFGIVSVALNITVPMPILKCELRGPQCSDYSSDCFLYIIPIAITGSFFALLLIPACHKGSNGMIKTLMAFEILQFIFDVKLPYLIVFYTHEMYYPWIYFGKNAICILALMVAKSPKVLIDWREYPEGEETKP